MEWLNEPRNWHSNDGVISVVTDENTDFWRETFYGFIHDNGHFYYQKCTGDFTAEVTFNAAYESLYDQAGLMLRFSDQTWLKAGIEYVHGKRMLGTVLTRGQSDWAIGPGLTKSEPVYLRLTRKGSTICVQWAVESNGMDYQTLRLGPLSSDAEVMIGPMTCSPTRAGLKSEFRDFRLLPPAAFESAV
jgi:regulation of enolase protein 1 (concanavalin A-like superfamily)